MAHKDEELLGRLRAMFAVEAEEHLAAIATALIELESDPPLDRGVELIELAFRRVHTLKGAARAVNLGTAVKLCHGLETLFARLKQKRERPTRAQYDLLHGCFAELRSVLELPEEQLPAERRGAVDSLLDRLEGGAPQTPAELASAPAAAIAPSPGRASIRVAIDKLDSLLHQSEELVSAKLAAAQRRDDLSGVVAEFTTRLAAREKLRGGPDDGQALLRADDHLLHWVAGHLPPLAAGAAREYRSLTKMVDGLREDARKVVMVPFAALFEPLPGQVRDLAREQGKEIVLSVSGRDHEVDRRILEEIKDALLHLVRNAIDHGVEPPAERRALGKPEAARLDIAVQPVGSGQVEIVVADDGRGIDLARVRDSAVAGGLGAEEDIRALPDEEALALVFRSGLSTRSAVSDLSGRGLGLAIVRGKAEALGGRTAVRSKPGEGTQFRLLLPVNLASLRGVVVEAGGRRLILPSRHVERVIRVTPADTATVEGHEAVRLGTRTVRLVSLSEILGLPATAAPGVRLAALLSGAGRQLAVEVDAVLAEQEVLMKPFGWPLERADNLAGAAVLGDGALSLIIDVPALIAAAEQAPARRRMAAEAAPDRKAILIVEDSITARTLFKHVLEGAGYAVTTAVDGVDAWSILKSGRFDLVLSDIEMPRMDGVALTERIRREEALAELPVVLISSLDSREDRERGVEAGANAYIVKRGFDQSDLLDILRRLL